MMMRPYHRFSEIYDAMMQGRFADLWWKAFRRLVRKHHWTFSEVLDVAGGTGEIAGRFLGQRKKVELVDRSEAMIRMARKKHPGLVCHHLDMRNLALRDKVDLAVCVFGGLHYLSSLRQLETAVLRISRALKPGGVFCFDLYSTYYLRERFGRMAEVIEGKGYLTRWQGVWEPAKRRTIVSIEGFEGSREAWHSAWKEVHRHYAIALKDMRRILENCGLTGIEILDMRRLRQPAVKDDFYIIWAQKPLCEKSFRKA